MGEDAKKPRVRAEPRSALVRMQESRVRSGNAYSRARNGAERAVVAIIKDQHPSIYISLAKIVDKVGGCEDRAVRQSRIRSACAAWYRQVHPDEWGALLDEKIADQTAGTNIKIVRRVG